MTDIFPTLVKEEEQAGIGRKLCSVRAVSTNKIGLLREDAMEATIVAEGGEFPVDRSLYSTISVTVQKLGVTVYVPVEYAEDENYDYINDKKRSVTRAVQRAEDKLIIDTILADTGINSISADTTGELNIEDITEAVNYMEDAEYTADRLVIHPDQAQDLRDRGEMTTMERKLAETYAMQIIVTEDVSSGTALVMNGKHAVTLVVRRKKTIKQRLDATADNDIITVSERVGVGVVRPSLVTKIATC